MDVIVRSNNNPVNDMTTHVRGLINDLYKVIKTKSSQSRYLSRTYDMSSMGISRIKLCFMKH